jgi:hypothetical protein
MTLHSAYQHKCFENKPKGQSKIDNPEKLGYTRYRTNVPHFAVKKDGKDKISALHLTIR